MVCDRKVSIAKIVPLSSTDDSDAELMELAAAGLVRLAERPLPDSFFSMPGPRISLDRTDRVADLKSAADG